MNSAELEELAEDSGRADTGGSGDTIVARLDAATRIREGSDAELWVDARAMHVFDPASGRNLSLGDADERAAASAAARRHPPRQREAPAPDGGSARHLGTDGRQHLILSRSRSTISSLHSWVRISRYRSAATRM